MNEQLAIRFGEIYQHFKWGTLYRLLGRALDTETKERKIVYEPAHHPGEWFARPERMIFEAVVVEGCGVQRPRFYPIDPHPCPRSTDDAAWVLCRRVEASLVSDVPGTTFGLQREAKHYFPRRFNMCNSELEEPAWLRWATWCGNEIKTPEMELVARAMFRGTDLDVRWDWMYGDRSENAIWERIKPPA